jgi:hypothetical protein
VPPRALSLVLAFTALQGIGMGVWSPRQLDAQQPTPAPVVASTLFQSYVDSLPPGPTTVSVATITLQPGQATLSLAGTGALLLLVETGSVTILVDRAIDGLAPATDTETAGESEFIYRLRTGQRVTISTLGTIRFRGEGDESARILLLSLVPEGGQSLPIALATD